MNEEFYYDTIYGSGKDFDSSAIEFIAYNRGESKAAVSFADHDEVYVYLDVPESTVNLWVNSESVGAFYNKHITGKFFRDTTFDPDTTDIRSVNVLASEPDEVAEPVDDGSEKEDVTEHFLGLFSPGSNILPTSRFSVTWELTGSHIGGSPEVFATDETDALKQIQDRLSQVFDTGQNIAIKSVTHYFD